MKSIFLLAGERSGDRHGAGLMEELRRISPGTALRGMGGGEMHVLPTQETRRRAMLSTENPPRSLRSVSS